MKKKYDPNRVIKFEAAIKEKYGDEAVQNPLANWTQKLEGSYLQQKTKLLRSRKDKDPEETIEINGCLIPKKLVTRESNRTCPSCKLYSFSAKDDYYMSRYDVCEKCYIQYVEGREEQWQEKKLILLKNKEQN